MDDYVARAQRLRDDLRIIGETIEDEQLLTKLMAGLRNEFDVVIEVLTGQPNLDLATLTSRLQVTEARLETRKSKDDPTAYLVEGCRKCGKPGHVARNCRNVDKDGNPVICTYCGRQGHTVSRCFARKENERRSGSGTEASTSMVTCAF